MRPVGSFAGERVTVLAVGSFAFDVKAAGDYQLSTAPFGLVRHRLTLAEGEHVEVEPRLPAGCVATTGRLSRSGRVRSLEVQGCQRFRSFLRPGDYRIVIDRGGDKRDHPLRVARTDMRLRLRP